MVLYENPNDEGFLIFQFSILPVAQSRVPSIYDRAIILYHMYDIDN